MSSAKKILTLAFVALSVGSAYAADTVVASASEENLESRLSELSLPENVAPASVSQEKLYSVQNRYSDLTHRHEVNIGGSKTFNGNSFMNMSSVDLTYRYHLSNRWNLSLTGSYGFNDLTEGGEQLLYEKHMLPDAVYVKTRGAALVTWNPFYGKFRISMDNVMYFDQYVSVGPGFVQTQFATAPAAVADIGMAFYSGQHMSFRFGFRNDFYKEQRFVGSKMTADDLEHHLIGHLALGYTFGGDGT